MAMLWPQKLCLFILSLSSEFRGVEKSGLEIVVKKHLWGVLEKYRNLPHFIALNYGDKTSHFGGAGSLGVKFLPR